jgi:hypothetical protein
MSLLQNLIMECKLKKDVTRNTTRKCIHYSKQLEDKLSTEFFLFVSS